MVLLTFLFTRPRQHLTWQFHCEKCPVESDDERSTIPGTYKVIERHLHQNGLRTKLLIRVPDHTTRHRHHLCKHLHWTRNQWASVLFTDESWFMLSRNDGCQWFWRRQRVHYTLVTTALVVAMVLQCEHMCLVNRELLYTLWMVQWL